MGGWRVGMGKGRTLSATMGPDVARVSAAICLTSVSADPLGYDAVV